MDRPLIVRTDDYIMTIANYKYQLQGVKLFFLVTSAGLHIRLPGNLKYLFICFPSHILKIQTISDSLVKETREN